MIEIPVEQEKKEKSGFNEHTVKAVGIVSVLIYCIIFPSLFMAFFTMVLDLLSLLFIGMLCMSAIGILGIIINFTKCNCSSDDNKGEETQNLLL